jgi:hypothetical protein
MDNDKYFQRRQPHPKTYVGFTRHWRLRHFLVLTTTDLVKHRYLVHVAMEVGWHPASGVESQGMYTFSSLEPVFKEPKMTFILSIFNFLKRGQGCTHSCQVQALSGHLFEGLPAFLFLYLLRKKNVAAVTLESANDLSSSLDVFFGQRQMEWRLIAVLHDQQGIQ